MDKAWVWLPRASREYAQGAKQFVTDATRLLGNPVEMLCPCIACRNVCHQVIETVIDHLIIKGMDHKYKRNACWSNHGDVRNTNRGDFQNSESEAYELIRTAFANEDSSQQADHLEDQSEGCETTEDSEFKKKLKDAETPLYATSPKHTKVSAIMGLYRIKVKSGMSENFFDQLLALVHDMLPQDNVLPKSTDEMKKFLKIFGFGYDMIHACKNDCILYRKEYEKLESCPRCSASRWELDKHTGEEKKGIPVKVLRYFPIKERFKRMFRSKRMAEELRWHFNNASSDGIMRHPVDSLTWAQVNNKWPDFAAEPRNLRLGLSTDGMNPFSMQSTNYSTWPVFLVNYNMPPTRCMSSENIMLTMLIPGPTAPGNNIDVYLAPLIDDLKDLWSEGIEVYDSFMKEKFRLRALLLWSITDYPALGTLSGCKVKGKQACNVCGKDTHSRWLKFSRKYVYMGNRRRLRPGHPYRSRKGWFDNTVENGTANRIQTGPEIFEVLKNFKNEFGRPLPKEKKRKREVLAESAEEEYEEHSDQWRWKKRSILFQLPYWKDMPVRHNIDVMHVEKNVSDALLSTLMGSIKSKDGLKARKDLEDMGIRSNLHTEPRGKKTYLPPAAYWFSKEEKKRFCNRLSKFRGPDGYCANISNCVSLNPPSISSMKSHDHHVLMQNLFPVALRGLLPKGPRTAVTRVCNFFNKLCQRSIDPEKLIYLEAELVETMCQLERFFPPSLFDIMFHLPIHLAREARLGGPVHFRWMYPFERYMKTLKAYVKNYARPEACMAEGYMASECIAFCLEFLQKSVPVEEVGNRNEDIVSDELILEGRPLHKAVEITLSEKERDIAHRYVLMNTTMMDPYLAMHMEKLQSEDARCTRNEPLLWRYHTEENDDVEVPQEIEEEASQEVGEEHVSNQADTTSEPSMSTTKKKRTRGPTKMRKLAKDPMTKLDVYFNPTGQHSGPNSATLSSFLAVLVKEHVSVLLDDWRHLDDKTKDLMWEQVQGRFNLKDEWQKAAVLSQMNNAWRSFKSRLLSAVKAAESNAERLLLKPSNIQSIASWNNWIKKKTSTEFKIKSDKFRELKMSQIPHTTGRKGMFRLSQELKEKSSNPEKVTRSEVWLAGHTYKDGTPTRPELADTFEKIQSINSQMDSTSCDNIREDAVSQVLGKDKPGRVRGMGRGVTMTKLAFLQARDSKVEKLEATQAEMMSKLNDVVRLLAGKNCPDLASQSGVSDVSKGGIKCQLLDWYAVDDVVVGEAELCSAEPSYKIGRIPLGPDALAVIVKSVLKPEAYLWRPTKTHSSIGEALGEQIPWPEDRVIFKDTNKTAGSSGTNGNESIRRYTIFDWKKVDCVIAEGVMLSTDPMEMVNGIPLGPNAVILSVDFVIKPDAYLWRPSEDKSTIGEAVNTNIAWPLHKIELLNPPTPAESVTKTAATASISTNNSNGNPKKKCIMFDSNNSGRIVAEGLVLSSNPADSIHCAPLGPNASKVMVQVPIIGDAGVWRPTSEFQFISDAVGTIVAWPNDKLKFV